MNPFKLILFYSTIILLILSGCNNIEDDRQIEVPQRVLSDSQELLIGGSHSYMIPFVVKYGKIYKVEMDSCNWCRILPNSGNKDSTDFKIAVAKNEFSEERTIRFTITQKYNGWYLTERMYELTQGVAGSSENGWVEIQTSEGGQLASKLEDLPAGPSGIKRLRVSGPLDDGDCKVIEEAMSSMPQLRYLDFENSLIEKFADKTFCNNSSITVLTLPQKLTSIGKAFYFDEQSKNVIQKINIPENSSLKYIDDSAFRNCRRLTYFEIPQDVSYIGTYAFYNCSSLFSNIVIPKGAGIVKPYAFCNSGMRFPENFVFPEYIKEIGESAFNNIPNCASYVLLPKELARIGKAAFCKSGININLIPTNLQEIPDSTFYGCGINQNLVIPSNIEKIGNHAFQNCIYKNNYWNLTISEGVKYIGNFAFAENYFLKNDIVIPVSTEVIGESCFADCENLSGKLILNDGLKVIKEKAFCGLNITGNLYIPKTLTNIEANAFANCQNINGQLVIPPALATIGEKAFYNCSRLEGLDLSNANNLSDIGISAFEACSGMQGNLSLSLKLTTIKYGTFKKTSFNGELTMTNNVKLIGKEAFMQSGFRKISLSSALEKIDDKAFYFCQNLKDFSLPSNIKHIGNDSFCGCTSLSGNLVLPSELEYLGDGTFTYCKFTGTLNFPPKINRIGNKTFEGCYFTGDLIIPDAIEYLGSEAFSYCRKFEGKLIIGKGIKKIGDYAFDETNFVGEVVIPDNVESMGQGAFAYSKFTTLSLGKGLKSIGYAAFYSNSLQTVKSYAITPPATISYNFHICSFNLYVPASSLNLYKMAEGWKEVRSINAL